jgi:N-acetylneuraminate synthase
VRDCKDAWKALGRVHYETLGTEQGSKTFRRSLYVVKDIRAGDVLTNDNIRSIRPGLGLPPSRLWNVLGKTASRDIARGEPLAMDMIEPA